jgi:hypothetical protein
MVTVSDATAYISAYIVTSDDWTEADEAKQQRLLNVAQRTLTDYCDDKILSDTVTTYTLPDNAVYECAAYFAIVFNDTNKMQQQGVAGFGITGVGSFTFKQNNGVINGIGQPLDQLIPDSAKKLIDKVNGTALAGRNIGWLI